jgi:hypothetical protein
MDGSSLCDFFVLNLKGDLGDFGDFRLNGVLGESLKSCSCSSSTMEGSGSVSGCGVVFRVIVPLLFAAGIFSTRSAAGRRTANVSSAQPLNT